MKKLLIFLLFSFQIYAQNKLIDSLKLSLPKANNIAKLQILSDLSWELRSQNPEQAMKYANEQIALATNLNNEKYIADGYNNKGVVMIIQGNEKEALGYHQKALEIRKKINDPKLILSSLNKIGIIHGRNGNFLKSLEIELESLKICEQLNDQYAIILTRNNIAMLYARNKRPAEGLKMGLESLDMAKKNGNKVLIQKTLSNLGSMSFFNGSYKDARKYFEENMPAIEKRGDNHDLYVTYSSLSSVYSKENEFLKAVEYGERALTLAKALNNRKGQATCLANIGVAYILVKNNEKAFKYLSEAASIASEFDDKDMRLDIESDLAQVASEIGNYKIAYEALAKAKELNNTIFEKNSDNKFSELKIQFETEKKEQQITYLSVKNKLQLAELLQNNLTLRNRALLIDQKDILLQSSQLRLENQELEIVKKDGILKVTQQENQLKQAQIKTLDTENELTKLQVQRKNIILGVLGSVFLLSLLLGYLFYNKRQLQQKAQLQTSIFNQQTLATQAVLDGEERERKRIAADLHDGVGQTIMALKMNLLGINDHIKFENPKAKEIFEKSVDLASETAKEVRSISHQMMPNALIKSGLASAIREFLQNIELQNLKINLEVKNLDQPLEPTIEKVLYRVIQELVNNVIKHAQANTLNISIDKTDKEILAKIEDNGKGFDLKRPDYEGIGLKNIQDRIAYLKGKFIIESSKNSGTNVQITIPLT